MCIVLYIVDEMMKRIKSGQRFASPSFKVVFYFLLVEHRRRIQSDFLFKLMQSDCGTLCQYFASYLLAVSRRISAVSVSFQHRTTSFFIVGTALF